MIKAFPFCVFIIRIGSFMFGYNTYLHGYKTMSEETHPLQVTIPHMWCIYCTVTSHKHYNCGITCSTFSTLSQIL